MVRKDFKRALRRQRAGRQERKKAIADKKFGAAQQNLIGASYLHQQYDSPRCWDTATKALDEYAKLTTKKDQMKYVKEQILIRYLGLGWEEAYHPWSKNNHTFTPSELLKHLVETVIPLKDSKSVPEEPPIDLPTRPDLKLIGTKSADLVRLDNSVLAREERIRLEAMIERDRLEDQGCGDQLMELQEVSWPLEKIRGGSFRIDMCFEYTDDGETMLQWCRGIVKKVLKDKAAEQNHIIVQVEWDNAFVAEGQSKKTTEKLTKRNYNPEKHKQGSWREDLHHMAKTAEDL